MAVERAIVASKINTTVVNAHVVHKSGRLTSFVCLADPEKHNVVVRTAPFVVYIDGSAPPFASELPWDYKSLNS